MRSLRIFNQSGRVNLSLVVSLLNDEIIRYINTNKYEKQNFIYSFICFEHWVCTRFYFRITKKVQYFIELISTSYKKFPKKDKKPKFIQSKTFLGVVTVFAIVMLALPYYSSMFYPNSEKQIVIVDKSNIKTTVYKISGMTCASCEAHVNHEVNKLNGIVNSKTSYKNGNAIIEYDQTKTNELEIEKAINATGYKVTDKK